MATKRLRIFAGPNGSGKSTLLKVVSGKGIHLGIYINADDLKVMINENHLCPFDNFGLINLQKNKDFAFTCTLWL